LTKCVRTKCGTPRAIESYENAFQKVSLALDLAIGIPGILIALFFGYTQIHGNAMAKAKSNRKEQAKNNDRMVGNIKRALQGARK
jgi:hypothetical protein